MPPDWVQRVQHASEDTLFDMTEHLPAEAMEALLDYVASGVLRPPGETGADPFAHPDAQRRFRTFDSIAEMERALDFPWEKWAVFLHPAQRQVVEKTWSGPVRISGSAGTGKTIVALHRAVALARRHGEARILLTTFSTPLANALHHKLMHLAGIAGRITVRSLRGMGRDLFTAAFSPPTLAPPDRARGLLAEACAAEGQRFAPRFLLGEFVDVVDAWQLWTWEDYRAVARLGRKTRIGTRQREV